MLRSIKNIFITAALYLLMTVTSHAANTGNTMIKTYSTYNYQQTSEHLIAAIQPLKNLEKLVQKAIQ